MDESTREPPNATDGLSAETPSASHPPAAVQSLRQAMRRARSDDAERTSVLSDLRSARIVRLELLQEALRPLIAQIPDDVDYFDIALSPGANPRVFVDMIGFVEMGRDARLYRFVQDTRHGRTTIKESADIEVMVDAVTDYVARRLLERDKALAAEYTKPAAEDDVSLAQPRPAKKARPADAVSDAPASGRHPALRWTGILFAFIIDLLGSITFFTLIAALCWVAWNSLHGKV